MKEKVKTLAEKWEMFTKGAEEPTLSVEVKLLQEEGSIKAILSKEIIDRDGEVVVVSGIEYDKEKGVPLLDSHSMHDNVVENVLGRVKGIRKTRRGGISTLEGTLDFAPTPRGQLAKMLVEGGYVDSVSIGFGVKEYDPDTKFIPKSELYETSLVSVPANPEAKIDVSKSLKEQEEDVNKVGRMLEQYKTMRPAYKAMLKTFLSEELTITLGYEKKGDLLVDINNIYELLLDRQKSAKLETPEALEIPKIQPKQEIKFSQNQVDILLNKIVERII